MVNFSYKVGLTRTDVNRTYPARYGIRVNAEKRRQLKKNAEQRAAATAEPGWCVVLWERNSGEKNMDEKQVPPGQVQIKADEKEMQGLYSNLVMIQHHAEEFTLNFVYIFPNGTQGKLLSSMIVSPAHAKRIWRALGENISRFEAAYGPIKEGPEGGPVPGANIGFVQ